MIGMMWFDPDVRKTPAQMLVEGIAYFATKYGERPTLARVHLEWPEMKDDAPEGLRIERVRYVLPRNALLVVEETNVVGNPDIRLENQANITQPIS
jgi:hypothetical protein